MASPRAWWAWDAAHLIRTLLLFALIGAATPLKDVRLIIPKAVVRHKDAVLRCEYDLEEDQLYQIKWYKEQNEFFRYSPSEKPGTSVKIFFLPGVSVARERSDRHTLTLHKVDRGAEGRYSCEVTADQPSFATAFKEDFLTVVEVPHYPPEIQGLASRYRLGDMLRANCTTEPSRPPANLTIYVNGQQYVAGERVRDYKMKEEGSKRSPCVGIEIQLQPAHFGPDNKLKIRCQADIYDVYNKVDERSVELRVPNMPPPNVLETNQPPREYPWDLYIAETDRDTRQRPRGSYGDSSAAVPSPVATPLSALLLLLVTVVLR